MQTFTATSVGALDDLAADIVSAIGERRIVTFEAQMGAGKTTLIKALCTHLGTQSIVNSPTFAIVNDYELPTGRSIFHFDLYRLKSVAEALDMGCEEYFNSGNLCLVEWPDVIADLLPEDICRIKISVNTDDSRTIEVE